MQLVSLLCNETQSLQPLRKHPVMFTNRKQLYWKGSIKRINGGLVNKLYIGINLPYYQKWFCLEHTWCVELNLPQCKKWCFYDPFERIEANMNYTIIDHCIALGDHLCPHLLKCLMDFYQTLCSRGWSTNSLVIDSFSESVSQSVSHPFPLLRGNNRPILF